VDEVEDTNGRILITPKDGYTIVKRTSRGNPCDGAVEAYFNLSIGGVLWPQLCYAMKIPDRIEFMLGLSPCIIDKAHGFVEIEIYDDWRE
jgi:hypothetical protein